MKITLASDTKYKIETVVDIPSDMALLFKCKEVAFSPNIYDPVIVYEVPRMGNMIPLQNLIDYIVDREHRLS